MLEKNKIYNGDCLEVMKDITDNSIDLLLTDPPYGTNDGRGKVIKRGSVHTDFCVLDWDKELPKEYIKEIYRVLKDDRWGVVFVDKALISNLWEYIEKAGMHPRNTFYWVKSNKAPTPRCNFKSCVETAIVFTKGRTNRRWFGGGNQDNVFVSPFVSGKERTGHPTQKSLALFEKLIGVLSKEGDLVLDPFLGSGTTAIACINTTRNYIGIEKEEKYYLEALKRIENVNKQKGLF